MLVSASVCPVEGSPLQQEIVSAALSVWDVSASMLAVTSSSPIDVESFPPGSITGGKADAVVVASESGHNLQGGLILSVDWLNITFHVDNRDEVERVVSSFLATAEAQNFGKNHYRLSCKWETGASLNWSPGVDHCSLIMNGASLQAVGAENVYPFCRALRKLGGRATRFDGAADDYSKKLIDLDKVAEAKTADKFVGFQRVEEIKPEKRINGRLVVVGRAITFGVRGDNSRQVQFYDKTLESQGEKDCNRLEVRWFGTQARELFEALCEFAEDNEVKWWRMLANFIGGSIEFREFTGVRRRRREVPICSWWADVVAALGAFRLSWRKVKPALEASVLAFKKQYSRLLALVCDVVDSSGGDGEAFLLMLVRPHRRKIKGWRQGARDLGLDWERLAGLT